jgi:hypothetical protein
MQTWLVHMRQPRQLFHQFGFFGFLIFQGVVGGNALVALAHLAFFLGLIWEVIRLTLHGHISMAAGLLAYYLGVAALGYCVSAFFAIIGLWRRGLLAMAPVLLLTPVHWVLLSFAAGWSACELVWNPYFWNKTEHGLDKPAQPNKITRSLLELERHLTDLKRRGELPQIWDDAKGNAVNRRRLPRAAV